MFLFTTAWLVLLYNQKINDIVIREQLSQETHITVASNLLGMFKKARGSNIQINPLLDSVFVASVIHRSYQAGLFVINMTLSHIKSATEEDQLAKTPPRL